MNDEKLAELLQNLLLLQSSVSIALNSVGQFHGHDEDSIVKLIAGRDKLHVAILSKFAALRQQRDELAEACRYFVKGWQTVPATDRVDVAYRLARAALASIEETE